MNTPLLLLMIHSNLFLDLNTTFMLSPLTSQNGQDAHRVTRTRKDSDLSILTDAIQLQTLTPIIPGETTGAKPACSGDSLNTTYAPASISSPKLSKLQKRNSMVQFLALCWSIFLLGWNDGSTGPLLPRIQEHYRVC